MSNEQQRSLVAVRFRRNYSFYFPNDVAGFSPQMAESLVLQGIASLASDPEETSEEIGQIAQSDRVEDQA